MCRIRSSGTLKLWQKKLLHRKLRKLQNNSKESKQPKRKQNNLISALEELEITAAGSVEVRVVKTAAERPQRQKKLPAIYHDYEM